MLMNKTKSLYEAPTTDVLVVRFEGVICLSNPQVLSLMGTFGDEDKAGQDLIIDEGFNF